MILWKTSKYTVHNCILCPPLANFYFGCCCVCDIQFLVNRSSTSEENKMVNVPKTRRTFCKSKKCRKHTIHKVSQYKAGKASNFAQGKRRYDSKQAGFGGQTKPIFHKKVSRHFSCFFHGIKYPTHQIYIIITLFHSQIRLLSLSLYFPRRATHE